MPNKNRWLLVIVFTLALYLVGCGKTSFPMEFNEIFTLTVEREDIHSSEYEGRTGEEVMDITIIILVSEDVARELHKDAPITAQTQKLIEIAEELGVVLEPLHPGTEDPSLIPFFATNVLDMQEAKRVIAQFQASDVVESAFIKPPEEAPGAPP